MNDKCIYFFHVYGIIDEKQRALLWYNEQRICSLKTKTNGHQRRLRGIAKTNNNPKCWKRFKSNDKC